MSYDVLEELECMKIKKNLLLLFTRMDLLLCRKYMLVQKLDFSDSLYAVLETIRTFQNDLLNCV